ncbi:MAG: diadenylate cyclase CdaA [Polyangiaceae bacterium]|nr:diadenylate cyclase CdaA [Polyangiaceae bacterium]
MFDSLLLYFAGRSLLQLARDAFDILTVAALSYAVLLVLRGTRAMQVGLGLALVFLVYVVAEWLHLLTLLSVMGSLVSNIILVIVVVFQSDIRRGLQRVGSSAWLSFSRTQESQVIDEVVEAATELARHRIGAIITFEQDANLDEFVGAHKGQILDAKVSSELLVALFVPEGLNKLHDGAVIIRNLRIAKAGVFFPMPERSLDSSFGSRHRAALGITEETDAVVVIVSEERGTISFCFNGNIASNLDGGKLRSMLEAIFNPKVRKKSRRAASSRRTLLPQPVVTLGASDDSPPTTRPADRTSGFPPPLGAKQSPESVAPSSLLELEGPQSLKRRSDSQAPPRRNSDADIGRTTLLEAPSLKRPAKKREGQGKKPASSSTTHSDAPDMSTLLTESHPMPRVEIPDRITPLRDTRDSIPPATKPGDEG